MSTRMMLELKRGLFMSTRMVLELKRGPVYVDTNDIRNAGVRNPVCTSGNMPRYAMYGSCKYLC